MKPSVQRVFGPQNIVASLTVGNDLNKTEDNKAESPWQGSLDRSSGPRMEGCERHADHTSAWLCGPHNVRIVMMLLITLFKRGGAILQKGEHFAGKMQRTGKQDRGRPGARHRQRFPE